MACPGGFKGVMSQCLELAVCESGDGKETQLCTVLHKDTSVDAHIMMVPSYHKAPKNFHHPVVS